MQHSSAYLIEQSRLTELREKTAALRAIREAAPKAAKAKPAASQSCGWDIDVLSIIKKMPTRFTLKDLYSFVAELAEKHVANKNPDAQIRHKMQGFRDAGLIRFVDYNGTYEKIEP